MDAARAGPAAVGPSEAIDPLVLAIDVGSSSARALLYDAQGRLVRGREAHRPYSILATPNGGVVIDADRLVDLVVDCLDAVLATIGVGHRISSLACDTFWHSLVGADREGRAVTPVYTWADTRSNDAAKRLRRRLDSPAVHRRTGCELHSSYWPAKLLWLSETAPDIVTRVAHWMSFGEYLYWRLFGKRRVSVSMASGTGLFDQIRCGWDEELLDVLGVDADRLSPLSEFSATMRGLERPYERRWPALRNVPWYLALGDGACNSVGSGGISADWLVAMIGTSGAIRVVRETPFVDSPPGVWTYRLDRDRVVQGGALSAGGNVFAWLVQTLQLPAVPELEVQLARMPPDRHGLTILPFLAGERSPDWDPDAFAVFAGMTLATNPVDIVRASLEAVAYQFGAVYDALRTVMAPPKGIIGSGAGLIHSPAWLQMMSDVLGEPLMVSAVPEATSRGAALMVLESMRAIADLADLPAPLGPEYYPDPARTAVYRDAIARQQRLYHAIMGTAREAEGVTQ